MGIVWNPQIAFDNITIFTTLILMAHEHRNLLFLSSVFSLQASFSFLVRFIHQSSFLSFLGRQCEWSCFLIDFGSLLIIDI